MTAPVPPTDKGRYLRPGIPRIDWSHPLAQGLQVCILDVGGRYVELARNYKFNVGLSSVPRGQSPYGVATNWPGSNAAGDSYGTIIEPGYYLFEQGGSIATDPQSQITILGNLSNTGTGAGFSFATGYYFTDNTYPEAFLFGRPAHASELAPYRNWSLDIRSSADAGGVGVAAWFNNNNSALQIATASFNAFEYSSSAATARNDSPGSATCIQYQQGKAVGSVSNVVITTSNPYGTGDNDPNNASIDGESQLMIGSVYHQDTTECFAPTSGYVYYGYVWRRELGPEEIELLHYHPYCFMRWPEDDVGSTPVGATHYVGNTTAAISTTESSDRADIRVIDTVVSASIVTTDSTDTANVGVTDQVDLWDPTAISSNVVGWWDCSNSSSVTTVAYGSDTVATAIKPIAGAANVSFTNGTTSSCPLYEANTQVNGLTVLNFTSSQILSTSSFTQSQPFSIALFCQPESSFNPYEIVIQDASGGSTRPILFITRADLSSLPSLYAGNNATYGSDLVVGKPYVIVAQFDGSSSTVSLNGTVETLSTNPGTSSIAAGLQLSDPSGSSDYFGYVGDVLVVDGLLDANTRQTVEGWLAWKWGVESSLPAGHPYLSAAPTTQSGGSISASLSAAERVDSVVVQASVKSVAYLSSAEKSDAASSHGSVEWDASLHSADRADSVSSLGSGEWQASLHAVDTDDSSFAHGSAYWNARLSDADPVDSAAAHVASSWAARLASIESDDSAQSLASVSWKAGLAVSDPADSSASAGSASWTLRLSAVEARDSISSLASASWVAALSSTENPDSASMAGSATLAGIHLAASDPADTASAHGSVVSEASLSAVEGLDSAFITGSGGVSASLSAVDRQDSVNSSGSTEWRASLSAAGGSDRFVSGAGTEWVSSLSTADSPDSEASSGSVEWNAAVSASGVPDSTAAAGSVSWVSRLSASGVQDSVLIRAFADATASLSTADSPDRASLFENPVTGVRLSAIGSPDSVAAAARVEWVGALGAADRADSILLEALAGAELSVSTVDTPDSVSSLFEAFWSAVMASRDSPDSAAFGVDAYLSAELASGGPADSAAFGVDAVTGAALRAGDPIDSALFVPEPVDPAYARAASAPDSISASGRVSGIGDSSVTAIEVVVEDSIETIEVILGPSEAWPATPLWP